MMTAPSRPPVVALLLAAGTSRRFGSDKRLASLGEDRQLLGTSLATARRVFADVRVVLREIKRPSPLPLEQLG